MKRMSSSARSSSRRTSPKYAVEQLSARVGVELVVDREVREVEEAVAHARVLPVDDPQVLAVVEEVRVQEVVVARNAVARGLAAPRSAAPPPAPTRTREGSRRLDRARSAGRSRRRGTSRTRRESAARRERLAAPARLAAAAPARAIRSSGGTSPSRKRVTSHPSGSTNATTSGPIPAAAAARVASSSTSRSIPRSSVSLPGHA